MFKFLWSLTKAFQIVNWCAATFIVIYSLWGFTGLLWISIPLFIFGLIWDYTALVIRKSIDNASNCA